MQKEMLLENALDWNRNGEKVAIATVIATWGSAPRQVGAQMIMSNTGRMEGSVSGGCVEGAVIVEAEEAVADGRHRLLDYGVSDGDAFAVGLACGGNIRILVEPVGTALPVEMLERMVALRADRRAFAYVIDTASGARKVTEAADDAAANYDKQFRSDKSVLLGDVFVQIHNPPLRMAIVGAVHISKPLVDMAKISGFDVTVIDPRDHFSASERFPNTTVFRDWPDEALARHGLDARTAVIALTHDPKIDDPALTLALGSEAFYIGALGSKRTHAARLERLAKAGFDEKQCARIHGPVGLDIGAKTPAEIAISIMAEIVTKLRKHPKPAED